MSIDCGWTKCSTAGHNYDSLSGHVIIIGCMTNKAIAISCRSKYCNLCEKGKGKHQDNETCSKNHEGSSGSMESAGAVCIATKLFENEDCVFKTVVMDDDSTTKDRLQAKSERINRLQRTVNDGGDLSVDYPKIKFLADIGH